MPRFGQGSTAQLKTAVWNAQRVFQEVVKHFDCSIIAGHKGELEQHKNFVSGASELDWPDGRHNSFPSHAVDATPYPLPENWGNLYKNMTFSEQLTAWKNRVKFYELAAVVKFEAAKLGVEVRWGGDWDGDGDYTDQTFDDLVHFEFP